MPSYLSKQTKKMLPRPKKSKNENHQPQIQIVKKIRQKRKTTIPQKQMTLKSMLKDLQKYQALELSKIQISNAYR